MSSSTTGPAVAGEPVEFVFEDGTLTWTKTPEADGSIQSEGKSAISQNDILYVSTVAQSPPQYRVYTVEPVDSPSNIALPVPDVTLRETLLRDPPTELISTYVANDLTRTHLALPAEDIYVVISSKSGTGKAVAFFENTLQPFLEALGVGKDRYQTVNTVSHETIKELAETKLRDKASKGVKQTVILLSGDGGVVELLNGLVGADVSSTYKRPSIIPFPFGTGNALFHSANRQPTPSAHSPKTPLLLALSSLLSSTSHPLPSFRVSFSSASLLTNEGRTATPLPNNALLGCIVASYGFHSTLVADSDTTALRKHGDKRFQIVAQELLGDPHRYKAKLTLTPAREEGEKVVERETHAYILCAQVSNLEKAFMISPATGPLDDAMRVVHFDSGDGAEIMGVMMEAYNGGKHVERGDGLVGYEEVDVVRIDFREAAVEGNEGKWLRVCVDGLIVQVEEGGWMKVEKVAKGLELLDVVVC